MLHAVTAASLAVELRRAASCARQPPPRAAPQAACDLRPSCHETRGSAPPWSPRALQARSAPAAVRHITHSELCAGRRELCRRGLPWPLAAMSRAGEVHPRRCKHADKQASSMVSLSCIVVQIQASSIIQKFVKTIRACSVPGDSSPRTIPTRIVSLI
jgi:hypothetical protein